MRDLLGGGHAGESPYRHDPGARLSLTLGYGSDPFRDSRYPWRLPPRDRCAWSPEIIRERAREAEQCRQVLATIDTAKARLAARVLYRAQRRQTLAAIAGGLAIVVLVIATAILF